MSRHALVVQALGPLRPGQSLGLHYGPGTNAGAAILRL